MPEKKRKKTLPKCVNFSYLRIVNGRTEGRDAPSPCSQPQAPHLLQLLSTAQRERGTLPELHRQQRSGTAGPNAGICHAQARAEQLLLPAQGLQEAPHPHGRGSPQNRLWLLQSIPFSPTIPYWRGPWGHWYRTARLGLLWHRVEEVPLFPEGILTASIPRTVTPRSPSGIHWKVNPLTAFTPAAWGPLGLLDVLLQELYGIPFRESSKRSETVHGMQSWARLKQYTTHAMPEFTILKRMALIPASRARALHTGKLSSGMKSTLYKQSSITKSSCPQASEGNPAGTQTQLCRRTAPLEWRQDWGLGKFKANRFQDPFPKQVRYPDIHNPVELNEGHRCRSIINADHLKRHSYPEWSLFLL